MPGLRVGLAAAAAIGFVTIAGTAHAQSVVVREYSETVVVDDDIDEPVGVYEEELPAVVEAVPAEPSVYGWVAAPLPDCGSYWDGDSCLDARVDPPFLEVVD